MNNVGKLAARIRGARGKGDEEIKKAEILNGSQVICNGRVYSYKLAVDIVTYPKKKVYIGILDSGSAVVVGD